jgi:hypothetical protein
MLVSDRDQIQIVKDCALFDLDQVYRYNKRHLTGDNIGFSVRADSFENPIFISCIIAALFEPLVCVPSCCRYPAWYSCLAGGVGISRPVGAFRTCPAEQIAWPED